MKSIEISFLQKVTKVFVGYNKVRCAMVTCLHILKCFVIMFVMKDEDATSWYIFPLAIFQPLNLKKKIISLSVLKPGTFHLLNEKIFF